MSWRNMKSDTSFFTAQAMILAFGIVALLMAAVGIDLTIKHNSCVKICAPNEAVVWGGECYCIEAGEPVLFGDK